MRTDPTGPRTEPLDPSHAVRALTDARDREQVFELVLRAARSRASFAALLAVHADGLRGRRALAGDGVNTAAAAALLIPRDAVPALEAAIASRQPAVAPLATGEPFLDGLLEQLGGAPPAVLILPIAFGTYTAALVVAHRGAAALAAADIAELFPLAAAGSAALARVLAPRTRAASEGYEIEVSIDDAADEAADAADEAADAADAAEAAPAPAPPPAPALEAPAPPPAPAPEVPPPPPTAADRRDAIAELRRREAWSELARALRDLLREGMERGDPDEAEQLELLLELGRVEDERLGRPDRAIEAWRGAQTIDAADPRVLDALQALLARRERWRELVELLVDRASREIGTASLEAAARLYEEELGDAPAALLVWLAVLRREPEAAGALDRLDRLARAAGAWDEVIAEHAALAAELETAHPEAAARLWHLVGRWRRDHTADRAAAAAALDRALRANPDDLDALTELLDLLRAEARWTDLIALLERRAEAAPDGARRAELYAELGELYETRLARPADAIACYERARAAAPDPAPILVELHRLYLETEAWEALGDLLPRLVEALAPSAPLAVLVELHAELGALLADHLGRPDDAVHAFRDALALDPKHAAAHRGLTRVYEAAGHTDALLDATEAEVDAAPRADQLRRYGDLAAAWHELARHDRAAACWHKLLALEPRSIPALQGLARALRAAERWPELVAAQRALRELLVEPPARIELLLELAAVLEDRFDDEGGAVAAYHEVTTLDRDHRGALHALARLHDRAGRLQPALAALQRLLAQTTADLPARADLLQRIGHVQLAARDAANARASFAQAIALDGDSAAAHEGLARVHVLQGELVAAGEQLERAARLAADPHDTLRCLADAAWLYRHRLGDAERARDCLHRILERDPEHADARQALAGLLAETRRWEDLWPHLEQEVARAHVDPALPPKERRELYERAAQCAVELGRFPAAIELYDRACELEPRPALLLGRADALYRGQALDDAAAAYQAIATQHAPALDRVQLLGLYRRLAQVHAALGKPAQAQAFHHKVLALDPRHRETLEDLIELDLARGRPEEAVASLRALAAAVPPAERLPVLERIGDLYRDKLANPARAASTYVEALELDAGNRRLLQRLLDLQTNAGQWKAAVETIDRFLDHETDPARRGSYLLASAEIRRTELRDRPGALACYEAALDELLREEPPRPRALDVLGTLRELYAADRSWKQLEHVYRRAIKRLPKDAPALPSLWDALGELYRTALDHPQSAIEAFEVAHALDPDRSPLRARVLAGLYARTGARRPEQAPARAAKLVELDPANPDAYRALGRAALGAGRIDEAWCACRALVYLKQATPEEDALYRRHQAHEVRKATGLLDDDAWANVRHPDEDRVIGAIFALIWEAAVALRAGPPRTFDLKPKERMPVEEGTGVIAKIFRHAARVLSVPLPDVYVQPRRSGRLLLANCLEKGRLVPTVIVGRDLMTGYRDTEIAASVGALLAQLRPAYYLKLALAGPGELEAALAAAARLAGGKAARAESDPFAGAMLPELQRRVGRPAVEALRALVERLPEPADLGRWRAAVDAAAIRAGLLVSGELAATARMMSTETALIGGSRPAQRTADLIRYSVSPAYFAVRRHLGVAVE